MSFIRTSQLFLLLNHFENHTPTMGAQSNFSKKYHKHNRKMAWALYMRFVKSARY